MRRLVFFIAFVVGGSAVSLTQVSAVSVTAKPTKPVISVISSKSRGIKGKVDVTVVFQAAVTNSKSPLQLTEVRIGSFTCRSLLKATRCTVRNVPTTRTLKVDARSKNRNGFGPRSSSVSYKPANAKTWRRAEVQQIANPSTPTTTPILSAVGDLKFDFSGAVGLVLQDPTSTATAASVSKAAATPSNLLGMTKTGEVFDAVKSGSIKVKEFLIAPNDIIYLHAESTRVNGTDCVLLAVSIISGTPDCVETDTSFLFQDGFVDFNGTPLPGQTFFKKFQFDDFGGIAYFGIPTSARKVGFGWSPGSGTEVKYFRAGKKLLIRPNNPFPNTSYLDFKTPIKNFLLLRDGSLLVEEVQFPTEDYPSMCNTCRIKFQLVRYFSDGRRTPVTGFPADFVRTEPMNFINQLPNGTIIIGTQYGWLEVDAERNAVKNRPYFSWSSTLTNTWPGSSWSPYGNLLGEAPLFSSESNNCPVLDNLYNALNGNDSSGFGYFNDNYQSGASPDLVYLREICYDLARHWRKTWFANNRLVALTSKHFMTRQVGQNRNGDLLDIDYQGLLIQAYPVFKPIVTSITSVNVAQPFLNSVLLSGTDSLGKNKTVLFDLDSGAETVLISGQNELRISSLTLKTEDNGVYFGARRLSDNKSVIGKVNIATKELSILKEMPANLLNIQLLNTSVG